MTIKKFDRTNSKLLAEEVNQALQELAKKYGIKISPAGGTIGDLDLTLKIKLSVTDAEATTSTKKAEFEQYCRLFGLEPEDFGKHFTYSGCRYEVVGLALNRKKYPIRVRILSGAKAGQITDFVAAIAKTIRAA